MASCTTDAWRNYAPRVRLTVTESSSNSASATYSWKLELIIDSKPAANARPYGAVIDGETVAEGSFAIARSPGTYEIDSGTITIDRSTSVRTVQFSCYMDFADMTWSGTVGGYQDARGSFTLSAKPSYTVSYNANGGSGAPSSQTKWYGSSLRLSSNIPARTGYTFKSWTTSSNGSGTSYAPGASYTQNSAVTLYAQWTANTFSVIYNANGGINPRLIKLKHTE